MRLWGFRVFTRSAFFKPGGSTNQEYMEWCFPTKREAHAFAWQLLDTPGTLRVVCIDFAGRADDLVLRAA